MFGAEKQEGPTNASSQVRGSFLFGFDQAVQEKMFSAFLICKCCAVTGSLDASSYEAWSQCDCGNDVYGEVPLYRMENLLHNVSLIPGSTLRHHQERAQEYLVVHFTQIWLKQRFPWLLRSPSSLTCRACHLLPTNGFCNT